MGDDVLDGAVVQMRVKDGTPGKIKIVAITGIAAGGSGDEEEEDEERDGGRHGGWWGKMS